MDFDSFSGFLRNDLVKDIGSKPQQFKDSVLLIAERLHQKLDLAKDHLIKNGVQAFEKEDKEKVLHLEINDDSTRNVKNKISDLVASLDGMLKKTEFMDESIRSIKEDSITKLLTLRKGELLFAIGRKFEIKVNGKSNADVGWKVPQNKNYSTVDTNDDSKLTIFGTGCYNYYQTNIEFITEDVEIEFITNGYEPNNNFYFGVRNEVTDPNSNCMCCNPASVTFFRSSGCVTYLGTSTTENRLMYGNSAKSDVKIRIKLLLSDADNKRVYFEVNENGECGPYALKGERFILTSGSCGTCSGYIKIDSAVLI